MCGPKDMKPKRMAKLKTIAQLNAMVKQEKEKLAKLAAIAGGDGEEAQKLRAGMASNQTSGRKGRVAGEIACEIIGDESRVKKTAADDISIPFILWGNSQLVQLAGVGTLLVLVRTCC